MSRLRRVVPWTRHRLSSDQPPRLRHTQTIVKIAIQSTKTRQHRVQVREITRDTSIQIDVRSLDSLNDRSTYRPLAGVVPAAVHIASPSSPGEEPTRPRSKYDELVYALAHDPPELSTPPPIPPKADLGYKSVTKSVSIVAPSNQLHEQEDRDFPPGYTVSEPGHSSTPSASTSAWTSDRAPYRRTFAPQSPTGRNNTTYSYPSRLSWADKASVPIYRNSFPLASKQSSPRPVAFPDSPSQPGRRKLRKALARPSSVMNPMSASPPSPRTGSRIWRALSLRSAPRDPDAPHSPPEKTSSMFSSSTRRATSENGHANSSPPSRPPAQSRDSGGSTSASRSHSSSFSHSTCFSSPSSWSHSTPATSPDDTSPLGSPMETSLADCVPEVVEEEEQEQEQSAPPPQLTRGTSSGGPPTRKLKKRRPSQSSRAPISSDSVLGLSRSKTQAHTHSSSNATPSYLPPISPETPFGLCIVRILSFMTISNRTDFASTLLFPCCA